MIILFILIAVNLIVLTFVALELKYLKDDFDIFKSHFDWQKIWNSYVDIKYIRQDSHYLVRFFHKIIDRRKK